ncbi:protein CROWDED NUCLEI 4 [Fagus crenata]
MASPQSERLAITPSSSKPLSITPGSRVLKTPLTDEAIWKRLRDAGFDEESIKRRDKAALIAYIAKLEAEIFDHQHHMGLLILERKELTSKYEQIKASEETTEIMHRRDQAVHLSALAGARKREESLKKTIGVKDECIASLEKALHEMRTESAEIKVSADSKLAEGRRMVEDAQKKFTEAEAKLHSAESLQAEATRYQRTAERKLQEVEAREDDLRKHIISFKSDCEEKENEIILEKQSLSERQKALQLEHERLLDAQALLNQREDYIFSRSQEINRLEKETEDSKENIEKELRALNDEKLNLELTKASLSKREEDVVKREAFLNKEQQDLLVLQEKLARKESDEIQKVIANHETTLRTTKSEFDAELEMKRKSVEEEIETKRRAWELKEMDLRQRENLILEKEHDLEFQSRALADREKDVAETLNLLDEKENRLTATEKEFELNKAHLQEEKEEINKMKVELQKSLDSLDDKKKLVDHANEKLEAMKTETSELSVLEMKLKEEIDMVRDQKWEVIADSEMLKVEKAKFEAEWELIDEKREELRKEAERVAQERLAFSKFIKDERNSLKLEKDAMRDQYKHDVEALSREREDFMNKMVHDRTEWFSKMQQERADFLLEIEMQKRELENCFEKRREELESDLREREKAFEHEKKNELQYISSLKEKTDKELEQVALEMKRLDAERMEINLEREQRNKEWAELNNCIEDLKVQREKLKKQRELLHADREEIVAQIEDLKKLQDLKVASDSVAEMQKLESEPSRRKFSAKRFLKQKSFVPNTEDSQKVIDVTDISNSLNSPSMHNLDGSSTHSSARFSWIKRCTELIFKHSPEKTPMKYEERSMLSDPENESNGQKDMGEEKSNTIFRERQQVKYALGEPKVIVEVPHVGDNAKATHDNESEIEEYASEKCAPSISEQQLPARRKRRVKHSISNDSINLQSEQRQTRKKRRQQEDATAAQCAITESVISTQKKVLEDQHVLFSSSQTQEGAEEASVLVIDKIIQISEVTHEKTGTDNLTNEAELDCLLNPVAELQQNFLPGRGINGHANSSPVQNSVFPCGPKAPEKLQEVHNDGQVSEQYQVMVVLSNPGLSKEIYLKRVNRMLKIMVLPNHNEKVDKKIS